jgi:hypothetical protein
MSGMQIGQTGLSIARGALGQPRRWLGANSDLTPRYVTDIAKLRREEKEKEKIGEVEEVKAEKSEVEGLGVEEVEVARIEKPRPKIALRRKEPVVNKKVQKVRKQPKPERGWGERVFGDVEVEAAVEAGMPEQVKETHGVTA